MNMQSFWIFNMAIVALVGRDYETKTPGTDEFHLQTQHSPTTPHEPKDKVIFFYWNAKPFHAFPEFTTWVAMFSRDVEIFHLLWLYTRSYEIMVTKNINGVITYFADSLLIPDWVSNYKSW